MADRAALSQAFLARAGWGDARRSFLAGDASNRSYDRIVMGARRAVLMDAPPEKGEDVAAFTRIARHLTRLGLSAPEILAEDTEAGFLLLEDLGDDLFVRVAARDPQQEATLYGAATDVLVRLAAAPLPDGLPRYDANTMATAATLVLDWYCFGITGAAGAMADFTAQIVGLLATHANARPVLVLRDYHAENLLWLPERGGLARVGLLDFQLAQIGQPGYDLISMLQDARRDVSPEIEVAMIARYAAATGADPAAFATACAVLAAQRNLRILGVFARLCLRDAKPGYLTLMPRVWGLLQRDLAHPALAGLRQTARDLLPEPTPENLQRMLEKCGTIPTR